ncbi:hypothetical protein PPL_07249 [Heterostelium album PN500]|uniref:Uncharacterized protein n=1 Tax=Heterostelium pallidum (strain ATCC 26659 / Pp 5 / PN500) TaxID=670386 RepID=D3BET4_HETP5|nr:hypothetical protein PPL_07249 [Heterostelium album PN500]EFA80415.1 hypothetical protein PPL_07249 [Heterostelium album PN500]|eukprot:XP_020432535.1 hypothetical protein PPL_07249 [Heterostelium album PN500]
MYNHYPDNDEYNYNRIRPRNERIKNYNNKSDMKINVRSHDMRKLEKIKTKKRLQDRYDSDKANGIVKTNRFTKAGAQLFAYESRGSYPISQYQRIREEQIFRSLRISTLASSLKPAVFGTLKTNLAAKIADDIQISCTKFGNKIVTLVDMYPWNFIQLIMTYLPLPTCERMNQVWEKSDYNSSVGNIFSSIVYNSINLREMNSLKRKSVDRPIPNSQLLQFFEPSTGDIKEIFKYIGPIDREEAKARVIGTKCSFNTVSNLEEFKVGFNDFFTRRVLRNVTWKSEGFKVVVTGGSVLAGLTRLGADTESYKSYWAGEQAISYLPYVIGQKIRSYLEECSDTLYHVANSRFNGVSWQSSDIDLYLVCEDESIVPNKIGQLVKEITDCLTVAYKLLRTEHSITILPVYPYRPIQIVTTLLREISDHILYCDLDCTSFVYDPSANNIFTLERGRKSLNNRVNLISPNHGNMKRVLKYAYRGFTSVCFELCKHYPRCEDTQVDRLADRLYDDITKDNPNFDESELNRYRRDYVALENIPFGPSFTNINQLVDCLESRPDIKILKGIDEIASALRISPTIWKFTMPSPSKKCYQCNILMEDVKAEVAMCMKCKENNIFKLNQWNSIQLNGGNQAKYAVVTGARNKIGMQTALRLLRSGYFVLVTTRFPFSALANYQKEEDYLKWIDRLQIYGIDFRHLPSVDKFIKYILSKVPRLHILINNAAQTIRRPRAYYQSILKEEKRMKAIQSSSGESLKGQVILSKENINNLSLIPTYNNNNQSSVADCSQMTQIIVNKEDEELMNQELFPVDMVDEHGDQLDMRAKTTWNNEIEEISMEEMLEVQLINVTVPFMLISQLSPIMSQPRSFSLRNNNNDWSYIINVTSQEGSFNKSYQNGYHVHTNMAKASLNMMTLSTADQYFKKHIFICSVDPGWITKMTTNAKTTGVEPPLSSKDGAARILDPIYSHIKDPEFKHGVLYKHFIPSTW